MNYLDKIYRIGSFSLSSAYFSIKMFSTNFSPSFTWVFFSWILNVFLFSHVQNTLLHTYLNRYTERSLQIFVCFAGAEREMIIFFHKCFCYCCVASLVISDRYCIFTQHSATSAVEISKEEEFWRVMTIRTVINIFSRDWGTFSPQMGSHLARVK